jgi:hypothetical protein
MNVEGDKSTILINKIKHIKKDQNEEKVDNDFWKITVKFLMILRQLVCFFVSKRVIFRNSIYPSERIRQNRDCE